MYEILPKRRFTRVSGNHDTVARMRAPSGCLALNRKLVAM